MRPDDLETRLTADRLNDALEEIDRLEAARQAQAEVISRLLAEHTELSSKLAAADEQLAMFHGSRSWRWLKPARTVASWVRTRSRWAS